MVSNKQQSETQDTAFTTPPGELGAPVELHDHTPVALQARFPYMFSLEGEDRRRAYIFLAGVNYLVRRPDKVVHAGHGDFKPVIAVVERDRPEAIVLLGDLQARQPLHFELRTIRELTEIWFIHGNHDSVTDADYDNLWGSELADRNLLHGRVVEIVSYRVAGLGGIFRGKIWNPTESRESAPFPSVEHSVSSIAAGCRSKSGAGESRAGIVRASFAMSTRQCSR